MAEERPEPRLLVRVVPCGSPEATGANGTVALSGTTQLKLAEADVAKIKAIKGHPATVTVTLTLTVADLD